MHPIHLGLMSGEVKQRPLVVLTRHEVRDRRSLVTVAPITSRVRGLFSEVLVGPRNGLDHESVISCDNIATIPRTNLFDAVGVLHPDQEADLARAIIHAFDLEVFEVGSAANPSR